MRITDQLIRSFTLFRADFLSIANSKWTSGRCNLISLKTFWKPLFKPYLPFFCSHVGALAFEPLRIYCLSLVSTLNRPQTNPSRASEGYRFPCRVRGPITDTDMFMGSLESETQADGDWHHIRLKRSWSSWKYAGTLRKLRCTGGCLLGLMWQHVWLI